MGWQPGPGDGTDGNSDRDPGAPGGPPPARDPRLARFAGTGADNDTAHSAPPPSGDLAQLADELSGPLRRCTGATDNELVGLLRSWATIESWAASAKLGMIRE